MDMNQPAPRNAIDENRNGLIGKPINRVEGRLKVMGKAPYAHEVKEGGVAATSLRPPWPKDKSLKSTPAPLNARRVCCWC
jgi:hypothetical protein